MPSPHPPSSAIPPQFSRLLLIDDAASIREPLAEYLVSQGFAVTTAADAAAARRALAEAAFDLILCDIMMPGEDGLALTRHIRATSGVPLILLTAKAEAHHRIAGLEIGADDYVGKPFDPRELVARIRTVLRRANRADGVAGPGLPVWRFGEWSLRTADHMLCHNDGRMIALPNGEYRLLEALVRHPRQILSRDRLLDIVRGRDADLFDRAIDNLVSRLRRKLESAPGDTRLVQTVWGGGYQLAADVRRDGGP